MPEDCEGLPITVSGKLPGLAMLHVCMCAKLAVLFIYQDESQNTHTSTHTLKVRRKDALTKGLPQNQ